MRVLTEPPETIVSYLGSLGIDGIATLQNKFSHVLTCLQYRTDFADVMKKIKQVGCARRWESLRIRHAARRRDYAPLSVVKQFIQRHGIRTQIQWYRISKEHRKELVAMNIPINLQSIYSQRGEWAGWTNLWPETGQQPALRVFSPVRGTRLSTLRPPTAKSRCPDYWPTPLLRSATRSRERCPYHPE